MDHILKPGIQIRADSKFRVQVRRNGTYQSKTFGSIRAAEDWQRVVEGKATAEEVVDQKTAKRTTLAKACAWMIEGNHADHGSHAKNVVSKLRYWQGSPFATWSLPAIHDWDLIEWRRDVLDEDQAEDGEPVHLPTDVRGKERAHHRCSSDRRESATDSLASITATN